MIEGLVGKRHVFLATQAVMLLPHYQTHDWVQPIEMSNVVAGNRQSAN